MRLLRLHHEQYYWMEWEYCLKPSLSCLSLGSTYSSIAFSLHSSTAVDSSAANSYCRKLKSHSATHEPYQSNWSFTKPSPTLSCKLLAAGQTEHFDWALGSPLATLEILNCISMIGNLTCEDNMSCELYSRHLKSSCQRPVGPKGFRIPPFDQSLTPQQTNAFSLGPMLP